MADHVRVERDRDVLAITLARPQRRNAITVAMYELLAESIEQAQQDDSLRLITLRGEGQDFTAGNDLFDFLEAVPRDDGDIPVWRLLRALARNRLPLLAAVQGNAVGIGTTMLLHCDLVIAEEGARFALPFVDLGLVPEAASSLLLPDLAGRRRAARHFLLGESFGAQEALDFGLASHVAAAGQLAQAYAAMVERIRSKPRQALLLTQALLRHGRSQELLDRMEIENRHFSERLESQEVKASIAAFFASRAEPAQSGDQEE